MAATTPRSVAAIVVAGGSGQRLGAGRPKAFVEVAGRSLLEHAAEALAEAGAGLVVVVPAGWEDRAARMLPDARVVTGGPTRQESVVRGLAALPDDAGLILVHDAARAFVPQAVIERVLGALHDGAHAVVPVMPVPDSIRAVTTDGTSAPVHRDGLRAVQTPQGFSRTALVAAHAQVAPGATDDATLAEAAGYTVRLVDGDVRAFKITTALDLSLAEAMMTR